MGTSNEDRLETMDRFSGTTIGSSRFRHSTHMIPSPGSEGKHPKRFEPLIMKLPFLIGVSLLLFALGIALEIALFISNKNNGFRVPKSNVFDVFGDVSAQFLASFFPTLLILPVAIAWREIDWMTRWYQPYVILQKGNATAEESLLLDYIELGPVLSLFRAMHYKHRVIFWSSLIACLTFLFQPLAGSIFQIRSISQIDDASITSIRSIGLSQDILGLDAFLAAAGYVDASVLHGLGDPPFIEGGWATAEFLFPSNSYLNGTLTLNTAGIQTNVNCSNPVERPILRPLSTTSLNLTSKSIDGCVHSLTFDPNVATQQYGVDNVPCPGDAASLDATLQPVMFWYYHLRADDNSTQEVKTVFCTPLLAAAEVKVTADLGSGSLTKVTKVGNLREGNDNDVFGAPQEGRPFNGVIFDNSTNPYIQARAIATRSIIPSAVFRAASQLPNGPQSTYDLANGFMDITSKLYTRHLSIAAKSVFFVNQNTTLAASVESLVPRLKIDALPAHILSIILIFSGIIGITVQVINRRRRTQLLLAAPPGSIAAIVALTGRSGFGELLLPYDDAATLERKLNGLRFRLDRRTGAILAEEDEGQAYGAGRDDAMLALLGKGGKKGREGKKGEGEETPDPEASSSFLAYQAAAGILPWARSWEQSAPHSRTEYVP